MGSFLSSEEDPDEQDRNLRFYRNEISSKPWPGNTVDEMLKWVGKYDKLENNHNYIQWLFPIPEKSNFNSYAQPLREHEAEAIRDDDAASIRVLAAYEMMLDFYGMKLVSINSGLVQRSENYRSRYHHLNRSTHNYRRITRILQSLGMLGYERFQCPWIKHLITEAFVFRELPNLKGGCVGHWIYAIKDDGEREQMIRVHQNLLENPDCVPDLFHNIDTCDVVKEDTQDEDSNKVQSMREERMGTSDSSSNNVRENLVSEDQNKPEDEGSVNDVGVSSETNVDQSMSIVEEDKIASSIPTHGKENLSRNCGDTHTGNDHKESIDIKRGNGGAQALSGDEDTRQIFKGEIIQTEDTSQKESYTDVLKYDMSSKTAGEMNKNTKEGTSISEESSHCDKEETASHDIKHVITGEDKTVLSEIKTVYDCGKEPSKSNLGEACDVNAENVPKEEPHNVGEGNSVSSYVNDGVVSEKANVFDSIKDSGVSNGENDRIDTKTIDVGDYDKSGPMYVLGGSQFRDEKASSSFQDKYNGEKESFPSSKVDDIGCEDEVSHHKGGNYIQKGEDVLREANTNIIVEENTQNTERGSHDVTEELVSSNGTDDTSERPTPTRQEFAIDRKET